LKKPIFLELKYFDRNKKSDDIGIVMFKYKKTSLNKKLKEKVKIFI